MAATELPTDRGKNGARAAGCVVASEALSDKTAPKDRLRHARFTEAKWGI
jgi:hypothetical protein